MSIEKSTGYKTSDGEWYSDISSARRRELMLLLYGTNNEHAISTETLLDSVITNADGVIGILKSTGRKPRAKKVKVGRPKGSRPKVVARVPIDTEKTFKGVIARDTEAPF